VHLKEMVATLKQRRIIHLVQNWHFMVHDCGPFCVEEQFGGTVSWFFTSVEQVDFAATNPCM